MNIINRKANAYIIRYMSFKEICIDGTWLMFNKKYLMSKSSFNMLCSMAQNDNEDLGIIYEKTITDNLSQYFVKELYDENN